MAAVIEKTWSNRFEDDHLSIAVKFYGDLAPALNPVWNIFLSTVPVLGALLTERQELREDDPLLAMSFEKNSIKFYNSSIQSLLSKSGIGRKVNIYISDEPICSSFGGYYSLTAPLISIPCAFLTKKTETKFDRGIVAEKRNVAEGPIEIIDVLHRDDLKAIGHILFPEIENEGNFHFRDQNKVYAFLRNLNKDVIDEEDVEAFANLIPPAIVSPEDRKEWVLSEIKEKINAVLIDVLHRDDLKAIGHILSLEVEEAEGFALRDPASLLEAKRQKEKEVGDFLSKFVSNRISKENIQAFANKIPPEIVGLDRHEWVLNKVKEKIEENLKEKADVARAPLIPLEEAEREISNIYKFSQDEILFFIAREIASIKSNTSFFRIVSKVIYVASMYLILKSSLVTTFRIFLFVTTVPLPLIVNPLGIFLLAATVTIHLIVERMTRINFDVEAVTLLEEYFKDLPQGDEYSAKERALNAGKNAIEKLIAQNIERRERNELCRLYTTEGGDNLLDLLNPLLTYRLNYLQENFNIPSV